MERADASGSISHDGIVQKTDSNSVIVRILSSPACSGCHAEGFCSLSGKEEKTIQVAGRYNVEIGATVTVLMKRSMGYSALLLGYVLPLFVLVIMLVILISLSVSELTAGLLSLLALIPYYLTLYFFRKRINNKFTFTIKT